MSSSTAVSCLEREPIVALEASSKNGFIIFLSQSQTKDKTEAAVEVVVSQHNITNYNFKMAKLKLD